MSNPCAKLREPGKKKLSGFTLIELLITVAIVGLLAALLFPAADGMLRKARAAKCSSNLRAQGAGILGYANDNRGYLPLASQSGGIVAFRQIAPYVSVESANPLFVAYDYPIFMCPERPLKVLHKRVQESGGSATYGGYCYNPFVLGIPENNYPERRLVSFSRASKTWVGTDGNAQVAAYLAAPATIEQRIAYDHNTKAHPKAQFLMLDGHVAMFDVTELKANKDNIWADPARSQ